MREIKLRYVFRRKSDGHIYIIITPIDGLEDRDNMIHPMLANELWEHVGRDQWAGLLDKNGVEIYEGDIVRGPSQMHCETEWDCSGAWVFSDRIGKTHCWEADEIEVIGNIHENPELLK